MKVPLMAELTALTLLCCPSAHARDYGQQGTVFRVIETDLLASIKARLETMAANGTMERINRDLKDRTVARVNRPQPVEGLVAATTPRTWLFDPSISVADDIRDTQGQILVAAGTRVNPLDTVPLRQPLLFFNGDDADERRWAMAERQKGAAKLILVKGAPLAVIERDHAGTRATTLTREALVPSHDGYATRVLATIARRCAGVDEGYWRLGW